MRARAASYILWALMLLLGAGMAIAQAPTGTITLSTGDGVIRGDFNYTNPNIWTFSGGVAVNQSGTPTAVVPYANPYAAVGNCTANDAAAVAAASAAAVTAGLPLLIDRCYVMGTNETLAANLIFVSGGNLSISTGITVSLSGQIAASNTAQIFTGGGATNTVASAASFVSVAWWGAMTATDPGPAFRAALGSFRTYYIPPSATPYIFKSYVTGFIGITTPGSGLASTPVFFNGLQNFNVIAYGATFEINQIATGSEAGNCSCMFFLNNNHDFSWSGGSYFGTKNSLVGAVNAAFVNANAQTFIFRDIHLTGNFGAAYNSTCNAAFCGTGFSGDFQRNGTYSNIVMDAVGIGFDFAFVSHITFDNIRCNGAGVDGLATTGDWGIKCWSFIYDPPNVGFNIPALALTTSDSITVHDSSGTNVNAVFSIQEGTSYNIHDNYINGNNASFPGFGILIAWANNGGVQPKNVTIQNNFISGFGECFLTATIGPPAVTTAFQAFHFAGGSMTSCTTAAIDTQDTTGTLNTDFQIGQDIVYNANGANISANMALAFAPGVSCSGSPTSGFLAVLGRVTHC